MITPTGAHTATEKAFPNIVLDLATAALDPRISFSRASAVATRVNSLGLIEAVPAETARFDYNPVTLSIRGLLIEDQRTNVVPYSDQFENVSWTKVSSSISANATASPDGTVNADKLVEDTSNGVHHVQRGVTPLSGINYTGSVYVKAAERQAVGLILVGGGTADSGIWVNLTNGAFIRQSGTPVSFSISDAGNGYYRISTTKTTSSTATLTLRVSLSNNTATAPSSYQGDGVSGFFVWGAQIEAGSGVTSYIPTAASAVTRDADVATITGTNFSDWWQAGKGSALVRARPSTVSGTRPLIQFDDTTADNIIALRGNTTNPELYVRAGGSDQAQIDAGTIAANTSYRLAGAWATDNCAASVNSGTPVLDGVATIPVVTQARLGSDGTNYLNGHLESVDYYNERVLNAGLQVISSSTGRRSIFKPVLKTSIFA